jgi:predicted DNA-binding transcriptional regulator AlpA
MDTVTGVAQKLVGRAELIKLMGVSRSRVVQLTEQPDFPKPVEVLIMGNIWALDDVLHWADRKGRHLNLGALAPTLDSATGSTSADTGP